MRLSEARNNVNRPDRIDRLGRNRNHDRDGAVGVKANPDGADVDMNDDKGK